ncbi:GPR1/FUN34/yaaH family-domain-containing protein [Scheffersomyces xylosifermentans]|uniref:GPR1/FUN34/yaaH family-domain-containing protein n=1 Tax=Scheffersomyces xylosifermentans TaxID=1304137 RepID=UPI00315E0206
MSSTKPEEPSPNYEDYPIGKVSFSSGSEFVTIGYNTFETNEFIQAIGKYRFSREPYQHHRYDAVPLGLCAFGLTQFVTQMYNAQADGIKKPNALTAAATMYGGGVQFLTGLYMFLHKDPLYATVLTSYGAYWMALAANYIDGFGIRSSYPSEEMFNEAKGLWLLAWAIFTFMIVLATIKSSWPVLSSFITLLISFVLEASGELTNKRGVIRAAGVVGIVCAFLLWYIALGRIMTRNNSYILGKLKPAFL